MEDAIQLENGETEELENGTPRLLEGSHAEEDTGSGELTGRIESGR